MRFRPPNFAVAASAVEPAAHGVLDRLGLLEDFFEHVVVEAAQADVVGVDIQHVDAVGDVSLVAVNDLQRIAGQHGQFMVGQVDDLVGVAGQRRGVAGDEMLACADADDQRAAQPGGDHHFRLVAKDNRQAVGALQLRQGVLGPRSAAAGIPPRPCPPPEAAASRQLAIRWAITSVSVAERNS